jgi:hypothetical protein
MNIITVITFIRSFTKGKLNDGSRPALAPDRTYRCPSCGGNDVVLKGRLLTCQECLEIGSEFEFIETVEFERSLT